MIREKDRQDVRSWLIGLLCLGLIFGCTAGSPPKLKGTPLLDDFQSACVETGADPSKVEAVVKAMGAKLTNHGSTEMPVPMTVMSWTHRVGAVETRISASLAAAPATSADQPAIILTNCTVVATAKDDVSATAIVKWLGPAIAKRGDCSFPGCVYREASGRRTPIDGDADYRAAQDAGELMQLIYNRDFGDAHLSLDHFRSNPARSAPHHRTFS